MVQSHRIYSFKDVDREDNSLVGTLGVQIGELVSAGIPVPDGFIISATAYFQFLKANGLMTKISHLLGTANFSDPHSLLQVAGYIRTVMKQASLPDSLQTEIISAYRLLGGVLSDTGVMLRASMVNDQHISIPFMSPTESFMYVSGETNVIVRIKDLWASLFEPKALFYREQHSLVHFHPGMAVVVQKAVVADASGSIVTGQQNGRTAATMTVTAIIGSRDETSDKIVEADHYQINKETLTITDKHIGEQKEQHNWIQDTLHSLPVENKMQKQQKISDADIVNIAELGRRIERHFYFPQHVYWAMKDGKFTILKIQEVSGTEITNDSVHKTTSLTGTAQQQTILTGPVKMIATEGDLKKVSAGDIIVTETITPWMLPVLKKASGVITEADTKSVKQSGLMHKITIPWFSGVKNARVALRGRSIITLHGKNGVIQSGGSLTPAPFEKRNRLRKTVTKIYLTLDRLPADEVITLPTDGVGILRGEAITKDIGVHPKKMLSDGKGAEYTRRLAIEMTRVAERFSPRPVIYRAVDLTSPHYRMLQGGKTFEVPEENPAIGFHGAIRQIHDPAAFSLELAAVSQARRNLQHKNIWLMLPYVRSPKELVMVKKLITHQGLLRSASFQLWLSIQIPANVIQLEEFIEAGIDGVVINADELTALFLGTDRNNPEVSHAFDPSNEAIQQAYRHIISTCNRHNIPSLFSGSNLSDSMLKHLISWGITGLSVTPESIENVQKSVYKYERLLVA
jgi:pyruvate, water dikinase